MYNIYQGVFALCLQVMIFFLCTHNWYVYIWISELGQLWTVPPIYKYQMFWTCNVDILSYLGSGWAHFNREIQATLGSQATKYQNKIKRIGEITLFILFCYTIFLNYHKNLIFLIKMIIFIETVLPKKELHIIPILEVGLWKFGIISNIFGWCLKLGSTIYLKNCHFRLQLTWPQNIFLIR